jgi:hypothetical protein
VPTQDFRFMARRTFCPSDPIHNILGYNRMYKLGGDNKICISWKDKVEVFTLFWTRSFIEFAFIKPRWDAHTSLILGPRQLNTSFRLPRLVARTELLPQLNQYDEVSISTICLPDFDEILLCAKDSAGKAWTILKLVSSFHQNSLKYLILFRTNIQHLHLDTMLQYNWKTEVRALHSIPSRSQSIKY